MTGLAAVYWKELADHFSSRRFLFIIGLVLLAGLSATYVAALSIRQELADFPQQPFVFLRLFTVSGGVLPPFLAFISFFGPLIGVILGFDAINREQAGGTLSRVLSQPVYRDAVINGKFLAGLTTIAIMFVGMAMVIGGSGLRLLGTPPTVEEIWRIGIFVGLSIIYVAFWMSIGILFSIFIRRTSTSALAGIAIWLFFAFFMPIISGVLADTIVPLGQQPAAELVIKRDNTNLWISRISPVTLYSEGTVIVLAPTARNLGPVLMTQVQGLIPTPLTLDQSLIIIWPHIVSLIALTAIGFAISYLRFMKQEIRVP